MKTDIIDTILGIDIGTSLIKTNLYSLDGRHLVTASQRNVLTHERPKWVEYDMEEIWVKAKTCIGVILNKTDANRIRIIGIGITGQGDGTWLIDEHLNPVRPAISWLDGRTGEMVLDLHKSGVSKSVFDITGTSINQSNQAVHLSWLIKHEPESIRKSYKVLRAKDWIFLKLTGKVSTDTSDASYTYFDIKKNIYDDRILDLHGISECEHLLPEVLHPRGNISKIKKDVAGELGLNTDIPVVSGPVDMSSSALGLGIIEPGQSNTILGTAGIHQVLITDPPGPPVNAGYTISHIVEGVWLRVLPSMTGTLNLQWFIKKLYGYSETVQKNIDWETIEQKVRQVPVGSYGIMYHPYIDPAGERAPFMNPAARAQFIGLNIHHSKEALLHAVYEGVALSALDCYSSLPSYSEEIRLAGGGSRSELWSQMLADALGRRVRHVLEKETGTKGAMINTAVALGIYKTYEEAVKDTVIPGEKFDPSSENHRKYSELLKIFRNTYKAMTPIWQELNNFSEQSLMTTLTRK